MDTTKAPPETAGLIDVTQLPLRQLWALAEDTVLANSLRRVTAAADEGPQQSVSAFNSAI